MWTIGKRRLNLLKNIYRPGTRRYDVKLWGTSSLREVDSEGNQGTGTKITIQGPLLMIDGELGEEAWHFLFDI